MTESSSSATDRVVCPAAKDTPIRLLIAAVIMLGMAAYCAYDGYVLNKYPRVTMSQDVNGFLNWAFNCIGPFVFGPIGLVVAVMGVRAFRRVLVADQDGIGYKGGDKTPWSQVEQLDASNLKEKNYLTLHVADGKPLKLASWNLVNFRDLVAFIEKQIPAERHKI